MRDTIGYRPHNRRTGHPRSRSESLAPGGKVRLLTSVPEMFPSGGNAEPASPFPLQPRVAVIPQPATLVPAPPQDPAGPQIQNERESAPQARPSPNDMNDNPSQAAAQEAETLARPRRPHRNFPMYFVDDPDHPGQKTIMMADELAAYQAKLEAGETARQLAEEQRRAAREAELAAGRPPVPDQEFTKSDSGAPSSAPIASPNNAAMVASTHPAHVISSVPPDFVRHSRLCSICSHPDRDAIEGDFVRWRKPAEIAEDYNISSRYAIYRHAHATGLFLRRQAEMARVLEKQLERADDCPLEQFDVITRAARLYSHLDANGRWSDPPRTHYVFTGPAVSPPDSTSPGADSPASTIEVGLRLANPK